MHIAADRIKRIGRGLQISYNLCVIIPKLLIIKSEI